MIFTYKSLQDALLTIDRIVRHVAIVINAQQHLLGVITDRDTRPGILKKIPLSASVRDVMNSDPTYVSKSDSRERRIKIFESTHYRHLPVLDGDNRVVGIEYMDDIQNSARKENWAVLMAGGLGSRLRPLTHKTPKPLLKVGNKPLLETIIENFIEYGIHKFFISVNYKSEMIKEYFGDGSRLGVDISYVQETEKLGTAGALSLLPEQPKHPIFVMNGDLLTKVNFQQLLDFHVEHKALGTMCVREYDFQVPFGVVELENHHQIVNIDEKPVHRFFVNAGIYVLEPETLKLIPRETHYNMPDLFNQLTLNQHETTAFPIREYWMDIGHMKDFERANGEFQEVFQ